MEFESDRTQAISWAKSLFDNDFHILDTETTGLDSTSEAIEIAIIKSDREAVFNSKIKPIKPVPPNATAIHGITNDDLAHAPAFKEIYLPIKQIIESKPLVIYNLYFDRKILRQQCRLNNLEPIKFDGDCAMIWYSQYYGDWHEYHQSYVWQRLPGGDHSALGDCLATLALLKKMAGQK